MAAPHLDNPFGAKGGKGGKEDPGKGKGGKGGKTRKDKDIEQSDSDSELPKCSHPFCNEPSDPANFPVGLPWSSGKLKCLPGYCTKHRKESIAEVFSSEDMGEEIEVTEFVKTENVCRCKDAPPLACTHEKDPTTKEKRCGKPYPQYIYPDDPCVSEELCFFLRMMMVADELDRWEEEDRKKQKEEAKKKKKKKGKKGDENEAGKKKKTGGKAKDAEKTDTSEAEET